MLIWLRNSALCVVLACLSACPGKPVQTVTVVIGTITDGASGVPLGGAEVLLQSGSDPKATAVSDKDGNFQLQFDTPLGNDQKVLALSASLEGYISTPESVMVVKGRTTENSYPIRLESKAIASCARGVSPSVVVGHFRAPLGQPDSALSARIADSLRSVLVSTVQTTQLVKSKQPEIFACGEVEPKLLQRYGRFAKYLGVDVFVGGIVSSPGSTNVKVQMFLADGHGFMAEPKLVVSEGVDLNDPSLSRLAPEAMTTVMTGLAVGYKLANRPAECVELIAVSERLLPELPEALVRLREDCQSVLPNRGLL